MLIVSTFVYKNDLLGAEIPQQVILQAVIVNPFHRRLYTTLIMSMRLQIASNTLVKIFFKVKWTHILKAETMNKIFS